MRRRSLPLDLEGFVQPLPMRLNVSADAAIRIGAAHHCENGKQQHMRLLIEFTLSATRVENCPEERKKTCSKPFPTPPA
jgi:hypothetical protein